MRVTTDRRPFSLHLRLLFWLLALPALVGGVVLVGGHVLLQDAWTQQAMVNTEAGQLSLVGAGVLFASVLAVSAGAYLVLRRNVIGPIQKIGKLIRMADDRADRLCAPRGAAREYVELMDSLRSAIGRLSQSSENLTSKNRELERSRQAADASNHAKSQFMAGLSHEIRSPMTAILGYAELLTRQVPDQADVIESVTAIRHNAEQLLGMINDILDLSRIEIGRAEVERVLCRPWQILSEVIKDSQPQAQAKKLTLTAHCKGPIPQTIRSDPARLRQMLMNMVHNAIKFTETGSVEVELELDSGGNGRPPRLQVEVADTGMGMTPDQLERLFQPFAMPDAASRRRFGGMGLGLCISRRFARMLGGDITVRSTASVGSRFVLSVETGDLDGIPLVTEITSSQKPPVLHPVMKEDVLSGIRILLAEDSKDNRKLISLHLRNVGAEVLAVEDGREACDAILSGQGGKFDIVLMDMEMPLLDGYGATKRLRLLGYAGLIVALTASNEPADREKSLAAGCNHHIAKPVERQVLVDTLSRLVSSASQKSGEQSAA